jgi:hypothetical protein
MSRKSAYSDNGPRLVPNANIVIGIQLMLLAYTYSEDALV